MTTTQDPITHAARLLREAAEELRQAHAFPGIEGWENETDAKAAYDEHMAAAQALEDWEAAVGAGGGQALSAAPADVEDAIAWLVTWKGGEHTYVHAHASELPAVTQARVMGGTVTPCVAALAASPTTPAEQPDLTKLTERGAKAWAGVDVQALRDGTYQQAATKAAPAGFVPVAAFDRLHAHAESLAARLLAASPTPQPAPAPHLLAADHKGMRVDYSGLLGQCRRALQRREPVNAEMLRQLQGHLQELGRCWYAGDIVAVDEFLQLYCIEHEARAALAAQGGE